MLQSIIIFGNLHQNIYLVVWQYFSKIKLLIYQFFILPHRYRNLIQFYNGRLYSSSANYWMHHANIRILVFHEKHRKRSNETLRKLANRIDCKNWGSGERKRTKCKEEEHLMERMEGTINLLKQTST